MIYMNTSSMGLPAPQTRERVARHTQLEHAHGPLHAKEMAAAELAALPQTLALLLGAPTTQDRIGFETTTTAPWCAVLMTRDLRGRTVLAASEEWGANLRYLHRLVPMLGGQLQILPPVQADGDGLEAWQQALTGNVGALVLPLVSSVEGRLMPIAQIAALPRPDECLLLVDAAQALGQVRIEAERWGIDALAGTCRKWMCGPRGTALFWTAPKLGDLCAPATLCPSEVNPALLLGLGVAARHISEPGESQTRAARFWTMLRDRTGLTSVDDQPPLTGAVTLSVPAAARPAIEAALSQAQILAKWPNPTVDEPANPRFSDGAQVLRLSPDRNSPLSEQEHVCAVIAGAL